MNEVRDAEGRCERRVRAVADAVRKGGVVWAIVGWKDSQCARAACFQSDARVVTEIGRA